MTVRAFACDYDGTIATEGRVPAPVVDALEELREAGWSLLLVTGRREDDLTTVFPAASRFTRLVLENGAVVVDPATGEAEVLGRRPPDGFANRLRERGVAPLSIGRVIVASTTPHEQAMRDAIHDLGLDLHLVLNRESVMALPSAVTKATGLDAALRRLKIPWDRVVGVGDAENDEAFLARCGTSVAVANALPALRERVDAVTRLPEGAGVVEIVRRLRSGDLAGLPEEMKS